MFIQKVIINTAGEKNMKPEFFSELLQFGFNLQAECGESQWLATWTSLSL